MEVFDRRESEVLQVENDILVRVYPVKGVSPSQWARRYSLAEPVEKPLGEH
jgi:hypothetical protein